MEQFNVFGLPKKYTDEMADKLNQLLSDFQIYYQNLRGMHWNIKGAHFLVLHVKLEELYNVAAENVDEIAERILILENQPLHTLQDYVQQSSLPVARDVRDPQQAINFVIGNLKALIDLERKLISVAEAYNDHGTITILSDYISRQEKEVWMLRSSLQE